MWKNVGKSSVLLFQMNGNCVCCVSVGISNTLCFHPKSIWISFILSLIKWLPHFSTVTYCLYTGWKQWCPLFFNFCTFLPLSLSWWMEKVKMPARFKLVFEFTCTYSESSFISTFRISFSGCRQRSARKYLAMNGWIWMNEWIPTCMQKTHTCFIRSFKGQSLKSNSENRTLR